VAEREACRHKRDNRVTTARTNAYLSAQIATLTGRLLGPYCTGGELDLVLIVITIAYEETLRVVRVRGVLGVREPRPLIWLEVDL
jgi:hypothetical protein